MHEQFWNLELSHTGFANLFYSIAGLPKEFTKVLAIFEIINITKTGQKCLFI